MSMSKIFGATLAFTVAEKVIVKLFYIIRDALESEDRERTTQYLKYKMDTDIQNLNEQIEALLEDFKNLEEPTQEEVQRLKDELEMNPGMTREKKSLRALESRLKRKVQQFFRRIKSLEEDLEKLPNTIMLELQFRRGVLKNIKGMKEGDIALCLESVLNKNMRELSQKIETLKEDVEECLAAIMYELQILRDELDEKKQGNKKKSAWLLECCKETEVEQVFSQIQAMMVWKDSGL